MGTIREMSFEEAMTVLRKEKEEENNWRSARAHLEELFESARKARDTIASLQDEEAKHATEVKKLNDDKNKLQTAIGGYGIQLEQLGKRMSQVEKEYEAKRAPLDADIAERQRELTKLDEMLSKARESARALLATA